MGKDAINLARSPEDTECSGCGETVLLGTFAYVNSDTEQVLCLKCGVERGWSSKDRVKQIITFLELKQSIKALKAEQQVIADGVLMLKKQVDLLRLGERHAELEQDIATLTRIALEYLRLGVSDGEKEALQKLQDVVCGAEELQKEIRDQVRNQLLWFETKPKKRRMQEAIA